ERLIDQRGRSERNVGAALDSGEALKLQPHRVVAGGKAGQCIDAVDVRCRRTRSLKRGGAHDDRRARKRETVRRSEPSADDAGLFALGERRGRKREQKYRKERTHT